jgi:hypothetical protein
MLFTNDHSIVRAIIEEYMIYPFFKKWKTNRIKKQ